MITQALETLRGELAAIESHRILVVDAISALERLVAVVRPAITPTTVIVDEVHAFTTPRAAMRTVDHTRRPLKDTEDDTARVLALLTRLGKLSLKAIAEGADLTRARAKYIVTLLREQGKVIAEGETLKRVFYVKGLRVAIAHTSCEELVPVWNGATKQSPADVLQARREGRAS